MLYAVVTLSKISLRYLLSTGVFCRTCRKPASVMVFGVDLLIMLRSHLILLKFANNRSCKST